MSNLPERCQRVQELASQWLDAELDSERRNAVDAHLSRCDGCHDHYAQLQRLSQRVRTQRPEPLPDGFAARVRETALADAKRAYWFHDPVLGRVAAAIILLLAVAVAYRIGVEHGADGTSGEPTLVNHAGFLPASHEQVRAARSLVSDVGVIDRVPENLRRPLIRAQMDHFDLPRWAEEMERHEGEIAEEVAHLASFVRKVDRHLELELGSWVDLRRQALDGALWRSVAHAGGGRVEVDTEGRRARRMRSVTKVAGDLPEEVRETLGRFLHLKDAMAAGDHRSAVMIGQRPSRGSHDLDVPFGMAFAMAFGEVGLDELAAPFLEPLRLQVPEAVNIVIPHVFAGRDPNEARSPTVRIEALRKKLARLFDSGHTEIAIVEESKNGTWSYKISISTGGTRK